MHSAYLWFSNSGFAAIVLPHVACSSLVYLCLWCSIAVASPRSSCAVARRNTSTTVLRSRPRAPQGARAGERATSLEVTAAPPEPSKTPLRSREPTEAFLQQAPGLHGGGSCAHTLVRIASLYRRRLERLVGLVFVLVVVLASVLVPLLMPVPVPAPVPVPVLEMLLVLMLSPALVECLRVW